MKEKKKKNKKKKEEQEQQEQQEQEQQEEEEEEKEEEGLVIKRKGDKSSGRLPSHQKVLWPVARSEPYGCALR